MYDLRSYINKRKSLDWFLRLYTNLTEKGKERVQVTIFLSHSLNYRRQRHLASRQRPLAAKNVYSRTKRLSKEILEKKNAKSFEILSTLLY